MSHPILASVRRPVALTIGAAVVILALASTALAGQAFTRCGAVQGNVAVVAHAVSCSGAKRVANGYLDGRKHPLGYQCRRYKSNAGAGWYAKCTLRRSWVQIIPE